MGCKEKKPFLVIHDDGVAATANPESATFPDSCQVTLNLPHAKLLHEKQGMIVGVRDPVSNRYDVQLQDEGDIKAWGSTIFKAAHGEIKWRVPVKSPPDLTHLTEKERNYLKGTNKKLLPPRPIFKQSEETNSFQQSSTNLSFTSPNTLATEGSCLKDTPVPVSPPKQRNILASPSSRLGTQASCLLSCLNQIFNFFSDCLAKFVAAPLSSSGQESEKAVRRNLLAIALWMLHLIPSSRSTRLSRILTDRLTPLLKLSHLPNQVPPNGTIFCCTIHVSAADSRLQSQKEAVGC